MAFCLSFPKWCNTYTLAEKIKALEHQTFSTHFTSKFMLFWITQKLTFFTHPNIKIGKNGNAPIHRRGFHVFFKNSWPSFTHLRPDFMALVICINLEPNIWIQIKVLLFIRKSMIVQEISSWRQRAGDKILCLL